MMRRLRPILLLSPAAGLLLAAFILPIAMMLTASVDNSENVSRLPRLSEVLRSWDGNALPGLPAYVALAQDLLDSSRTNQISRLSDDLGKEFRPLKRLVRKTASQLEESPTGDPVEILHAIDNSWGEVETWKQLQLATRPYTDRNLLTALDLRRNDAVEIVRVSESQRTFVTIALRTVSIALIVTLASLLIAFPLAYFTVTRSDRVRKIVFLLVLIPFWTSVLVRTVAWMVILGNNGLLKTVIGPLWPGVGDVPLIYTRLGALLAMIHIQVPFTLLPIYGVMAGISPAYMRSALSLGASRTYSFWRVYAPLTIPGVVAGCFISFIVSLGYYITPALVGGPRDQLLSYFIAYYINIELNWGMASALSLVLIVIASLAMVFYGRYAMRSTFDPAK